MQARLHDGTAYIEPGQSLLFDPDLGAPDAGGGDFQRGVHYELIDLRAVEGQTLVTVRNMHGRPQVMSGFHFRLRDLPADPIIA